jgi:hypothetical protein
MASRGLSGNNLQRKETRQMETPTDRRLFVLPFCRQGFWRPGHILESLPLTSCCRGGRGKLMLVKPTPKR